MTPLYFTTAEISAWISQLMWPFLRIGAMLMAAPLFGTGIVSPQIRIIMALLIAMVVSPLLPPVPAVNLLSLEAVVIAAQQILIGVAIGFVLQMVFNALLQAGAIMAMSMGLGFAAMADPQGGVQVPVVSSFFSIVGTLIFLSLNGHLALIELTVQSFHALPPGMTGLGSAGIWEVVAWGGEMYAGAVLVALPAVASLLLVSVAMGIIVRASPQLNIFAVGFPMKILLGFTIILITLPALVPKFTDLLESGFLLIAGFGGG